MVNSCEPGQLTGGMVVLLLLRLEDECELDWVVGFVVWVLVVVATAVLVLVTMLVLVSTAMLVDTAVLVTVATGVVVAVEDDDESADEVDEQAVRANASAAATAPHRERRVCGVRIVDIGVPS